MTTLTLHQQRKRLNQIFDNIISNKNISEQQFDIAMAAWIHANKKLEEKEEYFENIKTLPLNYVGYSTQMY